MQEIIETEIRTKTLIDCKVVDCMGLENLWEFKI